ncbi:hypothetical protein H2200_011850 [Cladophialophora chaetospira]|uniref:Xylanolytic transcriptional activator regulatory domain-containing protein n=1 Tax=Cladophialophora chaetospira TaxID=386627 RepID=A0AA39CCW8_9EURO|nr:hypothetical protein H2200_011850 [Cladophialophora chaetospira]
MPADAPLKRKRSINADAPRRTKAALSSPTSDPSERRAQQEGKAIRSPSINHKYPTGSLHFDINSPETADVSRPSPEETQQYGANDSTMGFAKIVFGEDDESDSPASGTIPGDTGRSKADTQLFPWITTPLPSPSILQVAVDAYFDRVNWYIMLFHQPTFTIRSRNLLRRSAWRRDELCDVLLVATIAAFGLRCVEHDKTWKGHQLLEAYSVTAKALSADIMSQIGPRFYEIMLETRIEAYQICMLLTTFHVYFGSSNFAWNVAGVCSRTAYALALHCDKARNTDEISREVSNRCWNHLVISDQFSSMIFGRPAALDPAFAQLKRLAELDDTELPEATTRLPVLQSRERQVTFLTYHTLKFEIYHIIRVTLQSFRVLQLQSPVSVQDLKSLIQIVKTTEVMLKQWQDNLPAVFKTSQYPENDPWHILDLDQCSPDEQSVRKKLGLQGFTLNILYDAARVWAHRPLLKLRISLSPTEDNARISLDDIPDSLGTSVQAALRMSRTPVNLFDGHLAQQFVLMHLFTAGIILCVAPTCQPYSQMASDAKAGVLRIIASCRAIKAESKIAKHTDQMLTKLYKKTMQREMDNALRMNDPGTSRQGLNLKPVQTPSHIKHDNDNSQIGTRIMPTYVLNSQVDLVTPTTTMGHNETPTTLNYPTHNAQAAPGEPVVSYLQFESLRHNERMDPHLNEHLDEAYGAFEQMFNLDFADFPFEPY